MKQYCSIHCFNYSGNKCPYCEADKINSYIKKYNKDTPIIEKPAKHNHTEKTEDISNEPVTDDMLNALTAKFNH
jgi:hypothetical protein